MSELTPKLWSDFDGTAVRLARGYDPRNWAKYPLPVMEGYPDFLGGVQSKGVEIGGVVSRRPNIFVRRLATVKSIENLDLLDFFMGKQVALEGSEEAKGKFVARQSRQTVVGMLEDKPHRHGVALMSALGENDRIPDVPPHPILIGVVNHARSGEYIDRLAEHAGDALSDLSADVTASGNEITNGFTVRTGSLNMHVVQLEPYSEAAGQEFGQRLVDLAA